MTVVVAIDGRVATCTLDRLPSGYVNAGFMQANVGRLGYAMVAYVNAGPAAYCK